MGIETVAGWMADEASVRSALSSVESKHWTVMLPSR